MTYQEALDYIRKAGTKGTVLGLETMIKMLEQLGNPQNQVPMIHIAGTNGKGSSGTFLSAILAESGSRVGRYVSPAVVEYREMIRRIEPGGEDTVYITEEELAFCVGKVAEAAKAADVCPTSFEIETAAAFLYFLEQGCDYGVIEVGLGGRLDATNVIGHPVCTVITSVSRDHMGMLGDTLEEIASEKAGIIKNGCPVVTVRQAPEAARVIEERARECKAPVYVADQEQAEVLKTALTEEGFLTKFRLDGTVYQSGLAGLNQIENGVLAILASEVLGVKEYAAAGLKRADWPGRFQLLRKEPYLVIDGAHNEGAALALRDNVKAYLGDRRVILVMGIFADKEYEKIVKIMADCGKELITFTTSTARALPARKLTETAEKAGYQVTERKTVQEAVKTAFQRAGKEDVILAFGSLSFLGDVIRWAGEGSLAP